MSQPSPRSAVPVAGCPGVVIFSSVSCGQRKTAGPAGEPVEQVLRIDGDIAGGAEESRVTGDAAHAARGWIVHDSAEHDAVFVLRRRDAAAPACRRKKARVLQAQRSGQVALLVLVEGQAGELLDERAQHDEVDVAVAKLHSRRR